jgi:hypothetical protein
LPSAEASDVPHCWADFPCWRRRWTAFWRRLAPPLKGRSAVAAAAVAEVVEVVGYRMRQSRSQSSGEMLYEYLELLNIIIVFGP